MFIGLLLLVFGYAILYWGVGHFGKCRYSLWCLLGMGSLTKNLQLPPGQPFKLSS